MVIPLADSSAEFGPPSSRHDVLVATPSSRTRELLAYDLAARGFTVTTAEDGVQAFDLYVRTPGGVEAVVVDVDLPDLPGLAFIGRFRHHFPGVPVFALTDDPFGPLAGELTDAGASVVPKPVHLRRLVEALWSALDVPSSR